MSDYTAYANFNNFVVTGRILDSKLVDTRSGDKMLAVTMITTPTKGDEQGLNVTFVNQGNLMALFTAGKLSKGRVITVTGHIETVSATYTKEGKTFARKRPQIELGFTAQILEGGFGALPKGDKQPVAAGTEVVVDNTPEY